MSDKKYPSNLYLDSVTTSVDFASHVSVEAVIVMAKELLALRKNRIYGIEVAAGVYTILGISGYHPSSTGCAQQKLMSKAGKVIHRAKDDGVEFDWYARWMD